MTEFLCPTTGKPCIQAQATWEVVGDQLLDLLQLASDRVSTYGYLANLSMTIDRPTIDNVRAIQDLYDDSTNGERLMKAIGDARDVTAQEISPVFISCGEDESGNGQGCTFNSDKSMQKTAVDTALIKFTSRIIENFNS